MAEVFFEQILPYDNRTFFSRVQSEGYLGFGLRDLQRA